MGLATWYQYVFYLRRVKEGFALVNYLLLIFTCRCFQWDYGSTRHAQNTVIIKQQTQRSRFSEPYSRCLILQVFVTTYTDTSTCYKIYCLIFSRGIVHKLYRLSYSYGNRFLYTRIGRTNTMYGGLRPDLQNVIFTNGDVDPWHALSVLQDLNGYSPAILIKGIVKAIGDWQTSTDLTNPHCPQDHRTVVICTAIWIRMLKILFVPEQEYVKLLDLGFFLNRLLSCY